MKSALNSIVSSKRKSILAKAASSARLASQGAWAQNSWLHLHGGSQPGARSGADGVGRQCVGQPAWCGVVQQSKNESLYDARKANEPPGPQPLSGRWERARGRSEGIFGHFCLSQFGLSAAHEQVQPSLVLAAQLELYKNAQGSGAGLKAGRLR